MKTVTVVARVGSRIACGDVPAPLARVAMKLLRVLQHDRCENCGAANARHITSREKIATLRALLLSVEACACPDASTGS